MLIKICGITSLEDARKAVELGATSLGFNFYPPSPRFIERSRAEEILAELPPHILTVGVYVGAPLSPPPAVEALQLHGLASQDEVNAYGRRVFVATSPQDAGRFPDYEIIVDTSWGEGRLADWKEVAKLRRPFVLSGGLTAENVADAIVRLKPVGVDVCSGVESEPGRKDPAKLRRFMQAVLSSREDSKETGSKL